MLFVDRDQLSLDRNVLSVDRDLLFVDWDLLFVDRDLLFVDGDRLSAISLDLIQSSTAPYRTEFGMCRGQKQSIIHN